VRIGDGALGKGSSWQETSQRDGAVANSETPNAKSETNQKHKERAFQTCTTLDARTQPRSITRQWRIAATEVTMSECAGLCPRPSQTTLQRPFRNVESTTVTWSPFARRKGVLSRRGCEKIGTGTSLAAISPGFGVVLARSQSHFFTASERKTTLVHRMMLTQEKANRCHRQRPAGKPPRQKFIV
jgi:hypothetical protein